jgi:hypothetical protein
MKTLTRSTKIFILILFLFLNTSQIYAQGSNSIPRVLWQKEFVCAEGISCTPHEIRIATADNNLFITGMSFRQNTNDEGKFWLWEIDQNGNEIKRDVFKETTETGSATVGFGAWMERGLKVANDRTIYTVGKFGDSTQSFLKTNREGTNISVKSVYDSSLDEGNNKIWKIIDLPDGNFFLVGSDKNSKALVIKIDAEGNRLWKKTYEAGKLSFFSDCVPVGNKGDFVIVGWSLKTGGKRAIEELTDIRILKCNANGEKMSEITFPGGSIGGNKFPQICQLDSGNFIVAYDKGTTLTSVDYHIKTFSSSLSPLWEKQMAKSEKNQLLFFHIKAVPGGSFVVSHSRGSQAGFEGHWVYKYDKDGNEIGKIFMDQTNGFGDFSLECTEDKVFIVSVTIPENREYITKVNVIAIGL